MDLTTLSTVEKLAKHLAQNPPDSKADYESFKAILFYLKNQEKKLSELIKAVKFLAKVVGEMKGDSSEESTIETAKEGDQGPRDQTPFPSGVNAGVTTEAPLTPDVQGSPSVNPAPIPKKAKNGSKDAASQG